jgi:hypothetical protein
VAELASFYGTQRTVGEVLRRMRCSSGCGGRVGATQAYEFPMLWWNRIVPARSYVHGWKIGPSHYVNQDLATIWLDK